METRIRIVVADDHPIFRKGLVEVIRAEPGFSLVGEASDGTQAWEMIRTLKPQVALMDIDMPGLDGLALAGRIQEDRLPIAVVILTIHKEEIIFNSAMDLGARGYVLKENAISDLTNAVRSVARGEVYLSPSISSFLLNRARRQEQLRSSQPGISSLTPMELRVLKLVAENQTNDEIGKELFISPRTVHTHRNNICTKLNLRGSRGLLVFAMEHRDQLQRIRLLPLNSK